MRSLADNSGITPIQIDSNFPFGAIIDETDSVEGTAVIRDIYNDILVNLYKLMALTGTTTNGLEDSEATTYQLLGALQKLPNVLNDILQTMTLASTTFSVPIAIDRLPTNYVLWTKVIGSATAGTTYSFKGTGGLTYNFVSPAGFINGDIVLVVINSAGVKAYSLGGGIPASGSLTFAASDLLGSDPFFYLPLSGSDVPAIPKYLTMYIQNGDGDSQTKMIAPAYVVETRIITGMPSPTDFPSAVFKLYFA